MKYIIRHIFGLSNRFPAIRSQSARPRSGGPTRDLDNNKNVKLFVKLPSWFTIDTPIGSYSPDWAFVTERRGS
jgi:Endonuclease domain